MAVLETTLWNSPLRLALSALSTVCHPRRVQTNKYGPLQLVGLSQKAVQANKRALEDHDMIYSKYDGHDIFMEVLCILNMLTRHYINKNKDSEVSWN